MNVILGGVLGRAYDFRISKRDISLEF